MQSLLADQVTAGSTAGVLFHFNRRNYLRYTLRTMLLLLTDKPGLLGPKVFVGAVLVALSLSAGSQGIRGCGVWCW